MSMSTSGTAINDSSLVRTCTTLTRQTKFSSENMVCSLSYSSMQILESPSHRCCLPYAFFDGLLLEQDRFALTWVDARSCEYTVMYRGRTGVATWQGWCKHRLQGWMMTRFIINEGRSPWDVINHSIITAFFLKWSLEAYYANTRNI